MDPSPRFSMSFEQLLEEVFENGNLSLENLLILRRYSANVEFAPDFKSIDKELIEKFLFLVFQLFFDVFRNAADGGSSNEEGKKRFKLALQCCVNLANRSATIGDVLDVDSFAALRIMISVDVIRTEAIALLVAVIRSLRIKIALSQDYFYLISDLVQLWHYEETSENDRSWISAFFSILLEEDYGFLADCFAEMKTDIFNGLLEITEALVDHVGTGQPVKFHLNNASFCVHLLARMLKELGDAPVNESKQNSSKNLWEQCIERFTNLILIIASIALVRPEFDRIVHSDTTAIRSISAVLESILDNEIVKESSVNRVQKAPDRPLPETPKRRSTLEPHFVKNFSEYIRTRSASLEKIGLLKRACVQAAGNLCCDSRENCLEMGRLDGVCLLLLCARRIDSDCPFQIQWAITALRHLCMRCPENQQRLAEIDQVPCGIVDKDNLLRELGLRAIISSETGKVVLQKIEE